MKKSNFKVIAEALSSGKLKDLNVSVEHLNYRKLTVDEIKNIIREAFGKAKDVSLTKAKELEKGWGDADVENQLNWVKVLKLKEFFNLESKEESEKEEPEMDDKEKNSSDC